MNADLWPAPVAEPADVAPAPRGQLAAEAVWWDAVAADARARGQLAREQLDAQARHELVRDGVAPTWRIPGVGTVPLALTADRVDVADAAAYTEWVADTFPEQVETVTTIQVRPGYDKAVRDTAVKLGGPYAADGQVIPGLVFVPGGQPHGISIRASSDAKESAAVLAEAALDGLFQARTDALAFASAVVDQVHADDPEVIR